MEPTGPLGEIGYSRVYTWANPANARRLSLWICKEYADTRQEIVRNPHLSDDWTEEVLHAPALLGAAQEALGPNIAVENTFLVIKWPGTDFAVPVHQDGINERLHLDPERSVSAWLAISDASVTMGGLQVLPGSHHGGYRPFAPEQDTAAPRGRSVTATALFPQEKAVALATTAGGGFFMDSRLLHRSPPNASNETRIGLNIRLVAPGACLRRDPQAPSLTPLCGSGW